MIEVDELTRYYGTTPALKDVSFTIEDRAIVGFLGLNGAGKSTLLEIVSGLLLPSGGTVRIDGVDAVDAPDSLRSKIGFLPENPPLYEDMTVDDFLLWCAQIRGMDRSTVEQRLPDVAEICAISHQRDRLIESLSHGYRKRVGIAQAIVHDPELVVLDEPISGLDPVQIVEMRDVLRRLNEHCTVLVSSHILSEISETCDRILVLHDGRLVADGTEEELAERIGATVRLEMTVRTDRQTCEEVLSIIEGVGDWSADEAGDDLLELNVPLERDVREELVEALVAEGVGIRRLEEAESELEQAFLGVTGESDDTDEHREAAA
ncbi:MAG: ABC transporter ATP-binding protein [Bradymonadaceae bacterium]